MIILFADIDECAEETDDCDENTVCVDTPGSYTCGKEFKNYTLCLEKIKHRCDSM